VVSADSLAKELDTMRARVLGAMLAAVLGAVAPGANPAAAHSFDEVLSAKKIVVGVNPTLPPLGLFDDQNKITGFDVDIATKLAAMLGVDLVVQQVGSADRVPFLVSGKIDLAMGGLTRTPDRAKVVDFTVPLTTETLTVLTTQAKPFASWHDLNDAKVTLVQVRGTTPLDFIKANIPNAKLLLLDNYPDAVRALAQGRGDAMIDVVDYMGQFMKTYSVSWKILKEPIGSVDYDAIGVSKGNDGLRRWLNVALFSLEESGFVAATYKKWFGIDMVFPVPTTPYF
jgi:polar amino acid transport system substrate-binding protein